MVGDASTSESPRSLSAQRRALERPAEFPPGWKGAALGVREDDGLGDEPLLLVWRPSFRGPDGSTRKTSRGSTTNARATLEDADPGAVRMG